MTIGEDRVRVKFNPGDHRVVDQIKHQTAELIDLCDVMRRTLSKGEGGAPAEVQRLLSLAQTAYEEAAMWAVKAATS